LGRIFINVEVGKGEKKSQQQLQQNENIEDTLISLQRDTWSKELGTDSRGPQMRWLYRARHRDQRNGWHFAGSPS